MSVMKSVLIHEDDLPDSRHILGMRVDATSYEDATHRIVTWARQQQSCYVCAANVHMTMEAYDNPNFAQTVKDAILVTPDGMPLVWVLKILGVKYASRVYGPTLTLHVCEAAASKGIPIGLYGGTPESLEAFAQFLLGKFPAIQIVCQISPPFRKLTDQEDKEYTAQILASKAEILFVGIGCPKQELWMSEHEGKIPAVMVGVGAAFDFHSGRVKQAPKYLQNLGLEWAFRLAVEPRRLWRRYLYNNPRFVTLFALEWILNWFNRKLFKAK